MNGWVLRIGRGDEVFIYPSPELRLVIEQFPTGWSEVGPIWKGEVGFLWEGSWTGGMVGGEIGKMGAASFGPRYSLMED